MFDELRINLILLILNIIALSNFFYPPKKQYLLILALIMIAPLPFPIKAKMRIITLLSIVAAFMQDELISEVLCILALGLAINTAYELDLTEGPSMINTALAISQILSFWSDMYLEKNSTNRDITLLIFTLPNLFLCFECQPVKGKVLYLISPILDDKWVYSLGFFIGIYTTSLTSIQKHYKFFVVALLLLIEANFTTVDVIDNVLAFLRGVLIYTEHVHPIERYFLLLYLAAKIFFKDQLLYLMFLGYLIIGVILLSEAKHKKQRRYARKDEAVGTQQIIHQSIQMVELKNK